MPDQTCDLAVQLAIRDSLQLFDRGDAVLEDLRQIGQPDAYYLTRCKTRTNVYLHAEEPTPLELAAWSDKQAADGSVVDQWVYLGEEDRLPVRLVAYRLPQAEVDHRRRQARQNACKKGRQVTQRQVQLLA